MSSSKNIFPFYQHAGVGVIWLLQDHELSTGTFIKFTATIHICQWFSEPVSRTYNTSMSDFVDVPKKHVILIPHHVSLERSQKPDLWRFWETVLRWDYFMLTLCTHDKKCNYLGIFANNECSHIWKGRGIIFLRMKFQEKEVIFESCLQVATSLETCFVM